jgi:uncharacterized membrane protein YdjX (TVP38/TMEM64 family)
MPEIIQQFLEFNVALAPVIFIIIRTISVVLAPIPATPLDLISIALFGRVAGFIYALISIMLGASIAFWLARQFGESLVSRFISMEKIHEWEDKLEKNSGFMDIVAFRFVTTAFLFDYLNYIMGLMKMNFIKFFIISLLGGGMAMAIFYYFGGLFLEKQLYLALVIAFAVFAFSYFLKKGKIFSKFTQYFKIGIFNGKG